MTQYVIVGVRNIGHQIVHSLIAHCLLAIVSEPFEESARSKIAFRRRLGDDPAPEAEAATLSEPVKKRFPKRGGRHAFHQGHFHTKRTAVPRLKVPRGIHRDGIQMRIEASERSSSNRSGRRNGSRK